MATLYFITKKDTETGKKFQVIVDEVSECRNVLKAFAIKYGFRRWRKSDWNYYGGMIGCKGFIVNPDSKIWKRIGGGYYYPKSGTKEGLEVLKEINNLPFITLDKLNLAIGFMGHPFHHIAFVSNNDEYFGFSVVDNWNVLIPNDCEIISRMKAQNLFMCGIEELDSVELPF